MAWKSHDTWQSFTRAIAEEKRQMSRSQQVGVVASGLAALALVSGVVIIPKVNAYKVNSSLAEDAGSLIRGFVSIHEMQKDPEVPEVLDEYPASVTLTDGTTCQVTYEKYSTDSALTLSGLFNDQAAIVDQGNCPSVREYGLTPYGIPTDRYTYSVDQP